MKIQYTIDFRDFMGQLISTKGIFDSIKEAEKEMRRLSGEMLVPIGYQDRKRSYLDIGVATS